MVINDHWSEYMDYIMTKKRRFHPIEYHLVTHTPIINTFTFSFIIPCKIVVGEIPDSKDSLIQSRSATRVASHKHCVKRCKSGNSKLYRKHRTAVDLNWN